ncbi:50S ribosomal protein L11 methyltransferase [Bosea sp. SSUT16]|jgi:ribosomal protein L11 methyltransferase|uniref:Ribosomal protein L11 methyltransferase n=1 Tax=Bosea spartocytisi TaxID=2773451 RepID=A0A927E8A1_9HYPH|nr:50S ribosomal protein L11 methyltransferase [Bosea spartocytisi]MBD3845827.1 50S ribosomal protein L11 methyltransferase [Bosea spartocytisi]MCT4473121.1 50S ribosomal protein L11 methyltransferase [Bosea spartocytisi]
MREGLLPATVATVFELSTSGEKARALTELLGEIFDPTETAISAFEIEEGVTTLSLNAPWKVEIYFANHPDEAAVRDLLRPIVGDLVDETPFSTVNTQDWVANSLDGLKPVRAGRVLVHGAHDRDVVRINDVSIEIEAALAFGTGHHGTTAGCLLALDAELKKRRPRHGLDVGTGTGILALALAKQIKRKVVAGDIDAIAVEVSAHNARLNHAPHALDLYVAPGLRHAKANRTGHFDLIFANILAWPLKRLAPSIARALSPDGTLILSGLLAMDVAGVASAYRHQSIYLVSQSLREGWATLTMKKGGAAPRPRRPA